MQISTPAPKPEESPDPDLSTDSVCPADLCRPTTFADDDHSAVPAADSAGPDTDPVSNHDPPTVIGVLNHDWPERLRKAADEAETRRKARAETRKETAERRRHGMTLRNAWRMTVLDARSRHQ